MKTHARNLTIGAVLTPLALALATLIANEAQTLIGLNLDRVALSIYLFPFLVGAAAVIAALLRLEASKIGGELGATIGDLANTIFGPPGEAGEPGRGGPPGAPQTPERRSAVETPPPGIAPSPPPPLRSTPPEP